MFLETTFDPLILTIVYGIGLKLIENLFVFFCRTRTGSSTRILFGRACRRESAYRFPWLLFFVVLLGFSTSIDNFAVVRKSGQFPTNFSVIEQPSRWYLCDRMRCRPICQPRTWRALVSTAVAERLQPPNSLEARKVWMWCAGFAFLSRIN